MLAKLKTSTICPIFPHPCPRRNSQPYKNPPLTNFKHARKTHPYIPLIHLIHLIHLHRRTIFHHTQNASSISAIPPSSNPLYPRPSLLPPSRRRNSRCSRPSPRPSLHKPFEPKRSSLRSLQRRRLHRLPMSPLEQCISKHHLRVCHMQRLSPDALSALPRRWHGCTRLCPDSG